MTTYDAILLSSFGGPEGQDDVIPFLRNVTRGRGIPDERLEEVAHHYRHHGGVSPINDQNRELKSALEAELTRRGIDLPIHWGNRNWKPYFTDAVREAHEAGHDRLLALVTSAYTSYSGVGQYREDFEQALAETGLTEIVSIDRIREYFDHPGFVTPLIEGVEAAVAELTADAGAGRGADGSAEAAADAVTRDEIHVLFVTHSIPSAAAEASGPQFGTGGAYVAQHCAVAHAISGAEALSAQTLSAEALQAARNSAARAARAIGEATGPDAGAAVADIPWSLVYQSRSGDPRTPWLEPDINDAIADLAVDGRTKAVIIVPFGFVSDHMEVMWDLDNEAVATATENGLRAVRVPTPGTQPAFVSGLVDLIEERLNDVPADQRPHVTELGPWPDHEPVGARREKVAAR
ncbi:ferrochelatase [Humibacter antri]